MSYYWFNKQELLKKQKKNATIMVVNNNVFYKKAKNVYRNLSEEEKEVKRQNSKDRYNKLKEKLS